MRPGREGTGAARPSERGHSAGRGHCRAPRALRSAPDTPAGLTAFPAWPLPRCPRTLRAPPGRRGLPSPLPGARLLPRCPSRGSRRGWNGRCAPRELLPRARTLRAAAGRVTGILPLAAGVCWDIELRTPEVPLSLCPLTRRGGLCQQPLPAVCLSLDRSLRYQIELRVPDVFCYILPCCKTLLTDSGRDAVRGVKKGPLIFRCAIWCLLPAAAVSWANIWVPLSSSPKGMGRGAGVAQSPGHSRMARAPVETCPIPQPSAAPHVPASLVKGVCPAPLLTHGAGVHGISGPMSNCPPPIPPPGHHPSLPLPSGRPSQCPATGCSAASSCTQPSSSHPLIRPKRSMLLYSCTDSTRPVPDLKLVTVLSLGVPLL